MGHEQTDALGQRDLRGGLGAELIQNHEGLGLELVNHLSKAQHLAGEGFVGGHHD